MMMAAQEKDTCWILGKPEEEPPAPACEVPAKFLKEAPTPPKCRASLEDAFSDDFSFRGSSARQSAGSRLSADSRMESASRSSADSVQILCRRSNRKVFPGPRAETGTVRLSGNRYRTRLSGWDMPSMPAGHTYSNKTGALDYVVSIMLTVNAVMMGVQVDYMAHNNSETSPAFRISEIMFLLFFVSELGVRMRKMGPVEFWRGPSWRWNVFDFLTVLFHSLEVGLAEIVGEENLPLGTPALILLRVFRLVRIMRLVRLLRFIQELHMIVYLILGSFWPFIWAFVVLLLMTYAVGIFLTQVVVFHYKDKGDDTDQELLKYFGSLGSSVLYLFAAITGGIDWTQLCDPLGREISVGLQLVFLFYIAFSVLVLMNLVTGVFVDSAKRMTRVEHKDELVREVIACFGLDNQSADQQVITRHDFYDHMETPHLRGVFAAAGIDPSEADLIWSFVDKNNLGYSSPEELVAGANRLLGNSRMFDIEVMRHQSRMRENKIQKEIVEMKGSLREVANSIAASRVRVPGPPRTVPSSFLASCQVQMSGPFEEEIV